MFMRLIRTIHICLEFDGGGSTLIHFKKMLVTLLMASSFLKTQMMLLGSIIIDLVSGPNEIFSS
jgi:hypothetical protein